MESSSADERECAGGSASSSQNLTDLSPDGTPCKKTHASGTIIGGGAAPLGRRITETEGTADPQAGSDTREDVQSQFARALSEHGAALRRLAASYADTKSDQDDLEQDIALAIWQALPGFRRECSERTFVFRIAHNRGIRHVSRRRQLVSLEAHEMDVVDPSPNAEAVFSSQQESAWLFRAVRSLPMIYREILVLALEGMDYSEISQVLGIGESNVGVRLNRARQLLRKLLEQPRVAARTRPSR